MNRVTKKVRARKMKTYTVTSLNRPELRVFLSMMGDAFSRHSNKVDEMKSRAAELFNGDPVKGERALKVIKDGVDTAVAGLAPQDDGHDDVRSTILTSLGQMLDTAKDLAVIEATNEVAKASKAYLDEVKDKTVANLTKELEKLRPIQIKMGTRAKKVKGVMPEEFEEVLRLAASRVNTLLVGPSGCGKTFIAAKVAEALDLNYASVSCSAGMSESMLTGWLIPTGAAGKFEYVPSEFVKCYEKGGVFLLDEVDAADPNTMVFINQAIANDHFFIPQRHNKPLCKKHADFHLIAAANTFGNGADMMFVGRNQLDAATLDRFRAGMVVMDYSEAVERALVDNDVYTWAIDIRNKIRDHRLRRVMSTRLMLDLTKLKAQHGYGPKEWERTYFADWSADEKRKLQGGY